MSAPDTTISHVSLWKRLALAALWLAAALAMGFVTAMFYGDHTSVIFVAVGLYVGIAGFVSSLLLPLVPAFRTLASPGRLAISVAAAAVPTIGFLGYALLWDSGHFNRQVGATSFFSVLAGAAVAYSLVVAFAVSRLESRWVA